MAQRACRVGIGRPALGTSLAARRWKAVKTAYVDLSAANTGLKAGVNESEMPMRIFHSHRPLGRCEEQQIDINRFNGLRSCQCQFILTLAAGFTWSGNVRSEETIKQNDGETRVTLFGRLRWQQEYLHENHLREPRSCPHACRYSHFSLNRGTCAPAQRKFFSLD